MAAHEDLKREHEIKTSSDRSFGAVFTIFFAIIAILPLFKGRHVRLWSAGVGLLFLLLTLAKPSLLNPLNRAWTKFGLLLSKITSPIATGILFYTIVAPIGLLMRALGKDPLKLKRDPQANTYWILRDPPGPDPKSMSNQF